MKDLKTMHAISNHLCENETETEKINFINWLNANPSHQILYDKLEKIWNQETEIEERKTFIQKFTKQKLKLFLYNQIIGKFIGFAVGMSVTASFSRLVTEKKSIHNLYGLLERKQIEVEIIPEWLQYLLAVLVGFIAFEFVNHVIDSYKNVLNFERVKSQIRHLKLRLTKK